MVKTTISSLIVIAATMFAFASEAWSQSQYKIQKSVFGSGGATVTNSSNYTVKSTLGESAIGETKAGDYRAGLGFWYSSGKDEMTIILDPGWNMISSYIVPDIDSIAIMLLEINENIKVMKNGAGKLYSPAFSLNQIIVWNTLNGYHIFMNARDTLHITGTRVVPQSTPIITPKGWNMVSYLRNSPLAVETALASIVTNLTVAKTNDGKLFAPAFNLNQIGSMQPGQGYMLYMAENDTIVYPSNSVTGRLAISSEIPLTPTATHLKPDFAQTGYTASIIVKAPALPEGFEIAVRNPAGKIVGTGVVYHGVAGITVWGDNELTDLIDGASIGDRLILSAFDPKSGNETSLMTNNVLDQENGKYLASLEYNENGIYIVDVRLTDAGRQELSLANIPNPFSQSTLIEYSLPAGGYAKIELYSINGSKVATIADGLQTKGLNKIIFDCGSLAAGAYNLVLRTDTGSVNRIVVIVK